MSFLNTVIINNKNIVCKELKVKHLKTIYKTLIGDTPDPITVVLNLNTILKKVTNLTNNEINNLSFVEFFLLLLELRSASIGDTIFVELTDEVNTKAEINTYKIINILNQIDSRKLLKQDIVDKFIIVYQLPTVQQCIDINNKQNFNNSHSFFVKEIIWNNQIFNFTEYNLQNRQQILEQLPAKITATIYKKIYKIVECLNEINLLKTSSTIKNKILPFNLNINNLVFLLKLVFGDQLMSLYDNMFLLSKQFNVSLQYIENSTPGEYFLYLKKLEKLTSSQQTRDVNIPPINNSFDPFLDVPSATSRSEFTP
jgi:hypothetical protein